MTIFLDCFGAVFGTCFGLVLALAALVVVGVLVVNFIDRKCD